MHHGTHIFLNMVISNQWSKIDVKHANHAYYGVTKNYPPPPHSIKQGWDRAGCDGHWYLGLQIHLRVPVWVIEDDRVSWGQVDPQPSSSGGKHEDKLVTAWHVKIIDVLLKAHEKKKSRWKCYMYLPTNYILCKHILIPKKLQYTCSWKKHS